MLISLPRELLCKIICNLPYKSFNHVNISCTTIHSYNLNQFLIPYGLSGISGFNSQHALTSNHHDTELLQDIKNDQYLSRQRGPLYCMYDMIAQLELMLYNWSIYDYHDVNQHDYIFRLLFYSEYYVYFSPNSLRMVHKKHLKLDKIDSRYHESIVSSQLLSALL